jgi:glycosyltransferase involved in cell wall biosynthesis
MSLETTDTGEQRGGSTAGRSVVVDGRMLSQPQCFGIARVIVEMLKHFPSDTTVPVKLLVPDHVPERFSLSQLPNTVETVVCTSPVAAPYRFRGLAATLRRLNAGVFFSPYHALAPLWVPCPLVVAVHDCIFESDLRLTNGRARQLAYMANTARVLRQAVAVAVPSVATAAAIPGYYSSIPPVTVCRNGVDPASFVPAGPATIEEARRTLQLPDRFVLHVGSRRPHKNQAILLRALAQMDPSISLVLVGRLDPRANDPVDGLISDLGLVDRVRVLDGIPDDLLVATYQAASVFAFPSLAEGFGLPPLEAMAAGVPVVASAIPVVAEVCGNAGLLVSPYEPGKWVSALTELIESEELTKKLVERGYHAAANAGWESGAARLFDLLHRTAEGSIRR